MSPDRQDIHLLLSDTEDGSIWRTGSFQHRNKENGESGRRGYTPGGHRGAFRPAFLVHDIVSGFEHLELSYFLLFPSLISWHPVDLTISACCRYPKSPWNKSTLTWNSRNECQILLTDPPGSPFIEYSKVKYSWLKKMFFIHEPIN